MGTSILHTRVSVLTDHESQKRAPDALKLELYTVLRFHAGAGYSAEAWRALDL